MLRVVVAGVVALTAVLYPASASSAAVQPVSRFDFDGDGLDDLVAGAHMIAPQDAPDGVPNGQGLIVDYPSKSTLDFLTSGNTGFRFGGAATAGNVNGDGYADSQPGRDWRARGGDRFAVGATLSGRRPTGVGDVARSHRQQARAERGSLGLAGVAERRADTGWLAGPERGL
jgi:hypothetical protein